MKYLRISLARKATLFTVLVIGITLAIWRFFIEPKFPLISAKTVVITVIITILLGLYFFIHSVLNPLNAIIQEMKALLTGRKYNRIFTRRIDEIGINAHFFNEITRALERASKDIKDQRRMSAELDIASRIQKEILPSEAAAIPGLNILAKTRSAAEIGGDSFDFIQKENHTLIYIGDVTGHGVPAGLVMMMVDTLIDTFADTQNQADQILIHTNKYLKHRINATMFMTMLMLRWQHDTKKFYLAGAGHEHLVHFSAKENRAMIEKTGGIALGMVPDISNIVKEREISFETEDILVAYSDGVTEAKNLRGELFGLERLRKITEYCGKSKMTVSKTFGLISDEFSNFTGQHVQEDDMTIIIMKQKLPTDEYILEPTIWETTKLGKRSLVDYK